MRGSPTAVTVLSAAPDVARCEVLWKGKTGVGGLRSAACGEMMRLEIICRDAFGNSAVPSTHSSLKFGFGLVETPSNEGKKPLKLEGNDEPLPCMHVLNTAPPLPHRQEAVEAQGGDGGTHRRGSEQEGAEPDEAGVCH